MYDEHYGLNGRPFQLTPDPRFWFDTATHKKAMAYLGYGLSQGEGFIVITGEIGSGKTTLVGHLVETVDAARLNVIRVVSTQIAPDDLLRTVCGGLDVDAAGLTKAQMLSAIERGLHAVARGGRRTLLVVDEAQALPVDSLEELRMLSNFQAGGYALLQIFLLGQPEFRDKLTDAALEQLRQRVIAMHHLGPMEADELAPYLIHRLSVVGWQGRPDFKADALDTIYAWSGGIPRRINQLVSRVLLHGAIEGIDTFDASDVMTVVADLGGDGMTGGETPASAQPELVEPLHEAAPIAAEPAVPEHDEDYAPLSVADDIDTPVAMEWPFVARHDEVEADESDDWRPILLDDQDDDDALVEAEAAARPIVVDAPEPEAEAPVAEVAAAPETPVESHPVQISAPPRMFGRVSLLGRRPILAPVDEAPVTDQPVLEAAEPAPARDQPESAPLADLDLARRLADIERRLEDQDVALRRVLTLLVDWVEGGSTRPSFADTDVSGLRDRAG